MKSNPLHHSSFSLHAFFQKFDLFAHAPDAVATMQSAGDAGFRVGSGDVGLSAPSGNAGLRTRRIAGLRTRSSSVTASAEPRVPNAEPRGPGVGPRGWHSRGYLPHFDSNEVIQHVTFHLADSLPKETVERLLAKIQLLDPERRDIEKRRQLDALVDAGHGACWLRRPDCARIVQDALLHFDGERYRMMAWVVMPNHVHTLFQTINDWSMNAVIGSWKTFTANAIGRLVRQPGQPLPHVWHPDFWDRFIRNQNHFASVLAYIHNNPVKAGLVFRPEDWPWSSAYPGNAGLRTRRIAGLRTRSFSVDASAEPRVPSAEPRVPKDARP